MDKSTDCKHWFSKKKKKNEILVKNFIINITRYQSNTAITEPVSPSCKFLLGCLSKAEISADKIVSLWWKHLIFTLT